MASRVRSTLRPRRLRQPDHYRALLVLILLDCAVIFTLGARDVGRWLPTLLVGATVVVGLETSEVSGRWVAPTRVGALLLVPLAIAAGISDSDKLLAWIAIAQALLLAILVVGIIGRVLGHQVVSVQTVLGVVCIYVLFGMIFAFIAFGLSGLTDRQFFVQTADPDLPLFLYFSFIVLTTVGFGDYTPANNPGRALVVFEALLGQIYLVTVVARLVSLYGLSGAPAALDDSEIEAVELGAADLGDRPADDQG
jgi:hypothetical protein